jgi:hypothetical protein
MAHDEHNRNIYVAFIVTGFVLALTNTKANGFSCFVLLLYVVVLTCTCAKNSFFCGGHRSPILRSRGETTLVRYCVALRNVYSIYWQF